MFLIYQLPSGVHARDAMFYKHDGTIFNAERARALFSNGTYQKVASVRARNLEHVYELTNLWPGNQQEWITRLAPRMHSLSVGDLVVNETTGGVFIVASMGFDFLVDGNWSKAPFDVVAWMAENGHPEYRDLIRALEMTLEAERGDPAKAERLLAEIAEVRDNAMDRYQDWATD